MKSSLAPHDMTVKSLIGSHGQIVRFGFPVAVKAGQRVYYGIQSDGTPVAWIATDTPTFDQLEVARLGAMADVIGILTSNDRVAPTPNSDGPCHETPALEEFNSRWPRLNQRGMNIDVQGTDEELLLLNDVADALDMICNPIPRCSAAGRSIATIWA
jgi:hypothetical protein